MKRLIALTMCAVNLGAAAQFPNLPYNPDDNADGLIGVADLQALLANYGSEFSSAILSEDGESAITFLGEMGYFECNQSCRELPGFWELSSSTDLALVAEDLNISDYTYTWIPRDLVNSQWNNYYYYQGHSSVVGSRLYETQYPRSSYRCYCSAMQLPRVEIAQCELPSTVYDTSSGGESCMSNKTAAGWYPLGGPTKIVQPSNGALKSVQAFWRWAE